MSDYFHVITTLFNNAEIYKVIDSSGDLYYSFNGKEDPRAYIRAKTVCETMNKLYRSKDERIYRCTS